MFGMDNCRIFLSNFPTIYIFCSDDSDSLDQETADNTDDDNADGRAG